MKRTISKKILLSVFVPFFVIFLCLSGYVGYMIFRYVNDWTELEIKGISEINAADLQGRIHSVLITVESAADVLEIIDPKAENSRNQAEEIIKSMFNNGHIYNSWLAYEPNAFDGRDSEDTNGYPGAPGGRFIRSYISENGEIIVAPDMDEVTIDDPEQSPWYVIPRDTGELYIDVDNEIPNLYDYGVGAEPVYTLSIVAPLRIEGKVVGCVGADLQFDNMTFGIDGSIQAAVAVFYPNGRIFYSEDLEFAEASVDTLQFDETGLILEAVSEGKSLFLPNEYSVFLGTRAFTYFQPVGSENGSLSLYVALPRDRANDALRPIFILIAVILAAVLAAITAMYLYVDAQIARPLRSLTLSADAISRGNLEGEIPSYSKSKDEIGMLSGALHRMVEQFRVDIAQLQRTQEELKIHAKVYLYLRDSESAPDAFPPLSALLCEHFGMYRTSFVLAGAGGARVIGCSVSEAGVSESFCRNDFAHYPQLCAIMSGKSIAFLNAYAISVNNMVFLDPGTRSACIAEVRGKSEFYGYVILENNSEKKLLPSSTEQVMLYITNLLGGWLEEIGDSEDTGGRTSEEIRNDESVQREKTDQVPKNPPQDVKLLQDPAVSETDTVVGEPDIVTAAARLDGMEVEAAISAMGGLRDVFENSLRLTIRLLPETMARLEGSLDADIKTFAIEIHGIKGALKSVGAAELAAAALSMEMAAKAGDIERCKSEYPPFSEKLTVLYDALSPMAEDKDAERPEGDRKALAVTLEQVRLAAESFDSLLAIDLISPLADYTYGQSADELLKSIILALEEFDCEKALAVVIELTEKLTPASQG